MNNSVFLITGASAGLGRELSRELVKKGAKVSLCARRMPKLKELKDELSKHTDPANILVNQADVCKKEDIKDVLKKTIDHFGSLDGVIANAGKSMWSRFSDISDADELNDLMNVNYMHVVYATHYSLPHLKKSNGSFVAISSIQGALPVLYHSGYVAAKHAVNGFIETVRLEEPDIHFLLAMPSWIANTELRQNALSSKTDKAISVKKHHGKKIITARVCAKKIVLAIKTRKETLFIPKKYRYIPLLRQIFKSLIDKIVTNKVKKQLIDS